MRSLWEDDAEEKYHIGDARCQRWQNTELLASTRAMGETGSPSQYTEDW